MVLRRQGSGALLPAHAHLPSMVASEKLSPRLGQGACPEIKLLVSYGGHFEQVSRLGRVYAAAGPCVVIYLIIDTFEALIMAVAGNLCGA